MNFDAATIREELAAVETALKQNPRNDKAVNLYINLSRKLRDAEYRENGYVTARNGMTGY